MEFPRAAAALTLLSLAACAEEEDPSFEDARKVEPMACAPTLLSRTEDPEDADYAPITEKIALTRSEYEMSVSPREEDSSCWVQPYVGFSPQETENLGPDILADLVVHNLVAMSYPSSSSFKSAYDDETLLKVQLTTNCDDFDNESEAPLCAEVCSNWNEPSTILVTSLCEEVVGIDGGTTDEFPVAEEPEEDTGL